MSVMSAVVPKTLPVFGLVHRRCWLKYTPTTTAAATNSFSPVRWCSSPKSPTELQPLVVYEGPMRSKIVRVKLLTMLSSACGFYMIPYLAAHGPDNGLGFMVAFGGFIGFFTFITPFLIHSVCRKYVVRLEYQEQGNLFTATTLSFFLREKKLEFTPSEVEVPEVPGMFTTLKAKGRPMLFDPSQFYDLQYYEKLVGLEYPVEEEEKKEQER